MKQIGAREWVYQWPTPEEAEMFEDLYKVNKLLTLAFKNLNAKVKDSLAKNKNT